LKASEFEVRKAKTQHSVIVYDSCHRVGGCE